MNFFPQSDVDVNVQDFKGYTPLHLASVSGNVSLVKQLLEAGADPLIRSFKRNFHISDEVIINFYLFCNMSTVLLWYIVSEAHLYSVFCIIVSF